MVPKRTLSLARMAAFTSSVIWSLRLKVGSGGLVALTKQKGPLGQCRASLFGCDPLDI
jgi:hypothetical protein